MEEIRCVMMQLGNKMWNAWEKDTFLTFHNSVWNDVVDRCVATGVNSILLDIGEGLVFDSHPELAVEGSWTKEYAKKEIARLRALGIDVVPKLNFSACHDHWLGVYRNMLCTPTWYRVAADVIAEAAELFGSPYFHLGMDEENLNNMSRYPYIRIRQGDTWWHDLLFLVSECEKNNVRPIVWADYCNEHPDEYIEKMPKSVIQNPWYYYNWWEAPDDGYIGIGDPKFQYSEGAINWYKRFFNAYHRMADAGFDIIPTGSNWNCDENMHNLVRFARANTPSEHLLGWLQTPWMPTTVQKRGHLLSSIDLMAEALN